jgi:hypothetical protein
MTDEQRARIHRVSMRGGDIRRVYEWLGRSLDLFTSRFHLSRPDECERFLAEHRDARARAEDAAQAIEDEIREANRGVPNDGPDQWGPL